MRRIQTLRTGTNVSAAVMLLIITTTFAAQIAGVPDLVLIGEGDEATGILTIITILGIAMVIFGTPLVLAVNVFHWLAARWFRAREGAAPGAPQGQSFEPAEPLPANHEE